MDQKQGNNISADQKKPSQLNPLKVTAKLLERKTLDARKPETKTDGIVIVPENKIKERSRKVMGQFESNHN